MAHTVSGINALGQFISSVLAGTDGLVRATTTLSLIDAHIAQSTRNHICGVAALFAEGCRSSSKFESFSKASQADEEFLRDHVEILRELSFHAYDETCKLPWPKKAARREWTPTHSLWAETHVKFVSYEAVAWALSAAVCTAEKAAASMADWRERGRIDQSTSRTEPVKRAYGEATADLVTVAPRATELRGQAALGQSMLGKYAQHYGPQFYDMMRRGHSYYSAREDLAYQNCIGKLTRLLLGQPLYG